MMLHTRRLHNRPHGKAARPRRRADDARRGRVPSFRQHLVLFVKQPEAGRVKTRLARGIGPGRAVSFYRHSTTNIVARLSHDPRWQTVLAVAPDAALTSRAWTSGVARVAQGSGDLGQRLERVVAGLPPGPVVVVGTDIPGIRPAHVALAMKQLGSSDAVFGPAPDGGYWLVGLKRRPSLPKAFRGVRWSSAHALSDTRANLEGLSVSLLGQLIDVDEVADLVAAGASVGRRVSPAAGP